MKRALIIAIKYALSLKKFKSQKKARKYYFDYRNKYLKKLKTIAPKHDKFKYSFQPESLKDLELWYFEMYENKTFRKYSTNRDEFEKCMGMYFLETIVRNHKKAKWIVEEDDFVEKRYELGVSIDELEDIMMDSFYDHYETTNNKRKQYIYREYKNAVGK